MSSIKARKLRHNQTDTENRLWYLLRNRRLQGYRFRRQHPIGEFIADFACTKYHLIIEADGGQHAENAADDLRTAWLEQQGWRVLRFWNNDVLTNSDGVMAIILDVLRECEREYRAEQAAPHPSATRKDA